MILDKYYHSAQLTVFYYLTTTVELNVWTRLDFMATLANFGGFMSIITFFAGFVVSSHNNFMTDLTLSKGLYTVKSNKPKASKLSLDDDQGLDSEALDLN